MRLHTVLLIAGFVMTGSRTTAAQSGTPDTFAKLGQLTKLQPTPFVFHQAGKIEPVLTDRNTAAVNNTVEAESKAIFLFKSVVALEKKLEETAPYVTQSD